MPAAQAAEVRLAISATPLSAPMIIAIENGYFRQEGLTPVVKRYFGGHRTIGAILRGEADIATSSEVVVMFHAFRHDNFQILCTFVSSDNDIKILVPKGGGITTVAQLRGRRIGTIRESSAHFFLSQTLQMAGIAGRDVSIVDINPENAAESLERGVVDAVAVWEPYGYFIRKSLPGGVVALHHDRAYLETFNAVAAKDFIIHHADQVDGVLRALGRAVAFIDAQPEHAQAVVAAYLEQDPAAVTAIWSDLRFKLALDQWLLTTLDGEAAWAKAEGLVSGDVMPNFLDYISLSPLERVNNRAVTIYR